MFSIDYIKEWSESYKTDLTTNIMPFWLKYGLDKVNGVFIPALTETAA